MPVIASTVAGLGTPSVDATIGILRVGSGASVHEEVLIWDLAQGAWIGKPRATIVQQDTNGLSVSTSAVDWSYMNQPAIVPGNTGLPGVDNGLGHQIREIAHGKDLWDAGLRLQEHLSGIMSNADHLAGRFVVAQNWFALAPGDTFLNPTPVNFGVQLQNVNDPLDGNPHFVSTGWQNSPITPPLSPVSGLPAQAFYPELYGKVGGTISQLCCRYRWVGGTVGGAGGSDDSLGNPPVLDQLGLWFAADAIPAADAAPIDTWPDQSGHSRHLSSVGTARPTLRKGVLNGHAVVRFDGSNDYLQHPADFIANVTTVFMVMKQFAGGAATQVWFDGVGLRQLVYHADVTDQVDMWAGAGADLIYHRAAPWPMPFTCISAQFNGATSSLWENKTAKLLGDAGSVQLGGVSIGAGQAQNNNAEIDVAEVLVYFKALNNTERADVIDYLNAKYALF